jgi:glutathione synthase/RimK-type ligase-like ATP-grasp enzyme
MPQALIGLAPLMRQAFSGIDLRPFGTRLIERAKAYPRDADTLMDLSTVLQLTGNRELGLATQAEALKLKQHYRLATATKPATMRLLAIMAGGDLMANTPIEFLVEGGDVGLDLLYVDTDLPLPATLPEHDAIFVAIGESDHNRPLLKQIEERAKDWTRPVVNAPQRIAQLTRNGACALLHDAPGINMPLSVRLARTLLEQVAAGQMVLASVLPGGDFPVIARPVGSHAGHDLAKLENLGNLGDYLEATPAAEFYISRFVDYRSVDGLFRKYRIMLIDGRPYVCHMAISENWMIHYLNAGMAESAAKRAEEARFMATFDMGFALRHARAFQSASEILQLDYVGLDCAESRDGELLIFEADSDMIVHNMDPIDMYPYKVPAMRKIFDAFHAMLVARIEQARLAKS